MESARRSLSFCELDEKDKDEENPLRDMFASSSSHVINSTKLEYLEFQPSPRWQLPNINPSNIYFDLSAFHLISPTIISIKETIRQIQENFDRVQSISLRDPKILQEKAKRKKT